MKGIWLVYGLDTLLGVVGAGIIYSDYSNPASILIGGGCLAVASTALIPSSRKKVSKIESIAQDKKGHSNLQDIQQN